jgi:transcriptional regulator with XRE-family HTH domain
MIGTRIRDLRMQKHLSQSYLAKTVGIPQPTLSDIEHNRYEPRVSMVNKFADVLGVTVDNLINDDAKEVTK